MTKRIVIPAILAATILVAGMFAFMPVQKASTVHTSIGTIQSVPDSETLWDAGEAMGVTCPGPFEVIAITLDITAGAGVPDATDDIDIELDADATAAGLPQGVIFADAFAGAAPADSSIILDLVAQASPLAAGTNGRVVLDLNAETAANDIDAATATFVVRASGTCTAT